MSRQVKRSSRAAEDLYEIAVYLLKDGLPVAERFLEAAEKSFGSLAETPLMGKPHPIGVEPVLRRWRVRGFENFLIFYCPLADGIEVVRVLHGAREIGKLFEQLDV
jgi:toxin ParE1/3/4